MEETLKKLAGRLEVAIEACSEVANELEALNNLVAYLERTISICREVADELATMAVKRETVAEEKTATTEAKPEVGITPELEEAIRRAAEERKEGKVELEVHRVEVRQAREIFGEAAKDPTRRYWVLFHRSREGREIKLGQIPVPADPSKVSPRSQAARYVARYGHLPKAGDKVLLKRNEKGFLELVL